MGDVRGNVKPEGREKRKQIGMLWCEILVAVMVMVVMVGVVVVVVVIVVVVVVVIVVGESNDIN